MGRYPSSKTRLLAIKPQQWADLQPVGVFDVLVWMKSESALVNVVELKQRSAIGLRIPVDVVVESGLHLLCDKPILTSARHP